MNVLTEFFREFAIGCRHFDWLDNLREHIGVDQIIRQQVMRERDTDEGDLEWAGVMEECRMELYVCVKRWPKPLVGNLGDPVGRMPLNLTSRGRRR